MIEVIVPILFVVLLSSGWVVVQILARKAGTKNHFDDLDNCGNGCNCLGAENCSRTNNKLTH